MHREIYLTHPHTHQPAQINDHLYRIDNRAPAQHTLTHTHPFAGRTVVLCPLPPKRIPKLPPKPLRQWLSRPIMRRPMLKGHVVGAKQLVEQRRVGGIVGVDCRPLGAVVPVVVLGCYQNVLEWTQGDVYVCVNINGLESGEADVDVQRLLAGAEQVERDQDQAAVGDGLHQMGAGAGHPVHVFGGVVNGVEAPQSWHLMECAMGPVEDEVCAED